jgi:signal transduction histidine kinase
VLGASGCTVWAPAEGGLTVHTRAGRAPAAERADEPIERVHRLGLGATASGGRLLVPLFAHGAPVGVLDVARPRVDDAAARATAVAELLGPALANERYREQLEERNRERGELLDSVLEIADRERETIAHRLHDGPLQTISALRLMVDVARGAATGGDTARAADLLDRVESYAAEAADDLRRMTSRLHPVVMEQRGLPQALSALAETVEEEYGVKATYRGPAGGWPTRSERDTALYQIAREAAVLAGRTRAAPICVELAERDGAIRLSITGGQLTGAGASERDRALSLRIIRERAARLGSELEARVEPGAPLEASLVVPVEGAASVR